MTDSTVKALPVESTLQLDPSDRALGRLVNLDVGGQPAATVHADLAADTFWNLYQDEPQAREDLPDSRSVNRALLEFMRNSTGFEDSRQLTINNLPAATASSGLLYQHLQKDEVLSEALEAAAKADAAREVADKAEMNAKAMRQNPDPNWQMEAEALEARAENARKAAAGHDQEAEALIAKAAGDPLSQAQVKAALAKAKQEATDIVQVMAGYGIGPGDNVYNDPQQALDFLAGLDESVREIARLAGRVKGMALTTIRQEIGVGPMLTQVGLTRKFSDLLMSERAYLSPSAHPALRAVKVATFSGSGLPGWLPTGDGEEQGPFVAAVDVSPSMHGGPVIIAKAVALGLALAAKSLHGRPYVLFCFASDRGKVLSVNSEASWQAHLTWAGWQTSGGTDFDLAFDEAMYYLEHLGDDGARKADLMFISDGEGHVSDDTIDNWGHFKEQFGTKAYYVPCGSRWQSAHYNIEEVVDETLPLDVLEGGEGAMEFARTAARFL